MESGDTFGQSSFPLPQLDDIIIDPTCDMILDDDVSFGYTSSKIQHFVPTLPPKEPILRITGDTLCDLLDGVYDKYYEQLFILDNRFSYECAGGHIKGSVNINSPLDFYSLFFDEIIPNSVIIFHCEFSSYRGPSLAQIFREIDRDMNEHPNLFYPFVYVLDGGYQQFYEEHKEYCEGGYTKMLDPTFQKNGELSKQKQLFDQNIEIFQNSHGKLRPLPQAFPNFCLESPTLPKGYSCYSPMSSKMLNFHSY